MSITRICYAGKNGSARKFAEEMGQASLVERIKAQEGNARYEYFFPKDDPETNEKISLG